MPWLACLQALAKHEILSAPMVVAPDLEEIGDGNTSPSLLGWIDIADILRAFLACERWRAGEEREVDGGGLTDCGMGGGCCKTLNYVSSTD